MIEHVDIRRLIPAMTPIFIASGGILKLYQSSHFRCLIETTCVRSPSTKLTVRVYDRFHKTDSLNIDD